METLPAAFYDHCLASLYNRNSLRELLGVHRSLNLRFDEPEVTCTFSVNFSSVDAEVLEYRLVFSFADGAHADVESLQEALAVSRNLQTLVVEVHRDRKPYGVYQADTTLQWTPADWDRIYRILRVGRLFPKVDFHNTLPCSPKLYEAAKLADLHCTTLEMPDDFAIGSPSFEMFTDQLSVGCVRKLQLPGTVLTDYKNRYLELIFLPFFESRSLERLTIRGDSSELIYKKFWRIMEVWGTCDAPPLMQKVIAACFVRRVERFIHYLKRSDVEEFGWRYCTEENKKRRVKWAWGYSDFYIHVQSD